jgi:hypothetical protein
MRGILKYPFVVLGIVEYPFVVLGIVLFLAIVWAGQCRSEEAESEARTKASLALSQAAKQRAASQASVACDHIKLEKAWREASRRGVPIVCWVAMRSDAFPEIKRSFGDVVHCEVSSNEGSSKPCVLFVRPDKMTYVAYCSEGGLRSDTALKMWQIYREVMEGPATRSPAKKD